MVVQSRPTNDESAGRPRHCFGAPEVDTCRIAIETLPTCARPLPNENRSAICTLVNQGVGTLTGARNDLQPLWWSGYLGIFHRAYLLRSIYGFGVEELVLRSSRISRACNSSPKASNTPVPSATVPRSAVL